MRTQCVISQQHANNLKKTDINVAELMYKLVKHQSAPEIDIDEFGGNPPEFNNSALSFTKLSKGKLTTYVESSHK